MNTAYDFEHVYTKFSTFSISYYIFITINVKGMTNASSSFENNYYPCKSYDIYYI